MHGVSWCCYYLCIEDLELLHMVHQSVPQLMKQRLGKVKSVLHWLYCFFQCLDYMLYITFPNCPCYQLLQVWEALVQNEIKEKMVSKNRKNLYLLMHFMHVQSS